MSNFVWCSYLYWPMFECTYFNKYFICRRSVLKKSLKFRWRGGRVEYDAKLHWFSVRSVNNFHEIPSPKILKKVLIHFVTSITFIIIIIYPFDLHNLKSNLKSGVNRHPCRYFAALRVCHWPTEIILSSV